MRSTAIRWNLREYRVRLSIRVSLPGKCAHPHSLNSKVQFIFSGRLVLVLVLAPG